MGIGALGLVTAAVLADASTSTNPFQGFNFNYLSPIISTGVVGLFLVMLLFRIKIMPTYVMDEFREDRDKEIARLEKENAELKEANSALRTLTEQQIIPALVRANQLSADYAQDLAAERRDYRGGH